MFEGQPKGLFALALSNTGERFGYYTMLAIFTLFLKANFGWTEGTASAVYAGFLALVYFLPLVGGALADRIGYGKCVTTGIIVMFLGYLMLSIPAGNGVPAMVLMFAALLMVCIGTSLFKGNLQVMVGNLYDDPKLQGKRDSAFSIFYMAINIGALFAPTAAVKIMEYAQTHWGASPADAYHYAFAVACLSLVVSIAIYYSFRSTFKHADCNSKTATADVPGQHTEPELTPKETKDRIVALCLVFAVVIFFWMAFHQNGSTLTFFAEQFTARHSSGVESMMFDVLNLALIIITVYAAFAFAGAKDNKKRVLLGAIGLAAIAMILCHENYIKLDGTNIFCIVALFAAFAFWEKKSNMTASISMVAIVACVAILIYIYITLPTDGISITAPIFQQFNPFFVVALTPVSMAIFGALAKRGKEPSAPRKIGLGMLVAGCGYVLMIAASMGLLSPNEQKAAIEAGTASFVSPNWLVCTYLVLTFGELLLSPMGISFVSKVAPPKYKGLMMGGWFVATAVGNLLVSIPGFLWGQLPLWVVWAVLVTLCLISAIFIFSIMKRLEKVC